MIQNQLVGMAFYTVCFDKCSLVAVRGMVIRDVGGKVTCPWQMASCRYLEYCLL